MDDACRLERARLIRESVHHADAERRTWVFTVQIVLALFLFALAPLVPRASHLFEALTSRQATLFVLPGVVSIVVSVVVYKTRGPEGRAYAVADAIETCLLYGINVAAVFGTRVTWSVLWILCPFSTVFWAATKPFAGRLFVPILVVAHAALALAYVVRGDGDRAWVAVLVAVGSYLAFAAVAKFGRDNLTLEAESNVAAARLNDAILDAARRRVANTLRAGIGAEIAELARELELDATTLEHPDAVLLAAQARSTLSGIHGIVDASFHGDVFWAAAELRTRIDEKCRPLCAQARYALAVDGDFTVDAKRGLLLVRVAQELTRNAIVHGEARAVSLELNLEREALVLRLEDDGSGLSAERFAQATGGLDNAVQSLREYEGVLELESESRPARLRATLPLGAPAKQT